MNFLFFVNTTCLIKAIPSLVKPKETSEIDQLTHHHPRKFCLTTMKDLQKIEILNRFFLTGTYP